VYQIVYLANHQSVAELLLRNPISKRVNTRPLLSLHSTTKTDLIANNHLRFNIPPKCFEAGPKTEIAKLPLQGLFICQTTNLVREAFARSGLPLLQDSFAALFSILDAVADIYQPDTFLT
jgi:hypothetical protein